jgi:hypothetical protein
MSAKTTRSPAYFTVLATAVSAAVLMTGQASHANNPTHSPTAAPLKATSLGKPPVLTVNLSADLAFDTQKSNQGMGTPASRPFGMQLYDLTITNKGKVTSAPANIFCNHVYNQPNNSTGSYTYNTALPAIAQGATHVFQVATNTFSGGMLEVDCTIDPTNAVGDSDRSNNRFTWKLPTTRDLIGLNSEIAPVKIATGQPDLTFDVAATTAQIQSSVITIKNIGTAASPARSASPAGTGVGLTCDATTQKYLDDVKNGINLHYAPQLLYLDLPSIPAGQSARVTTTYSVSQLGPIGILNCSIGGIAGEQNTSNNKFNWKKN